MPWHQIKQGQTLSDIADEHAISPALIWADPHNKKFVGGHTDGLEIFLPSDQWIFIPEAVKTAAGESDDDTQGPEDPTPSGATPPARTRGRANAIWTRSSATSVFRRPRANAVTQDDARFVMTVARKSYKAAYDAHHGALAKLKGIGRYHNVKFKESRWRKGAVSATGVAVPLIGFVAGSAATGGILIPVGLGVVGARYVLKGFYHHRDYKRRSTYYQRDMYCTPRSKRKHPDKYQVKKDEAAKKWWRRALVKIMPAKYEHMVKVKDSAYEESEFWRVRLIRDADQCIRPSVVHMRKTQFILHNRMGGFLKSVDPNVSDPQKIVRTEGVDTGTYDSFSQCDDYVEHTRIAMQYLHELDKFRTYLLPALNMTIFFLDRFLSLAHGWRIQQRKVEDAIDRFYKAGDHSGCKWRRKVRNILEPGKFKSLLAAHPHLNVRCYQKEVRPDIYLYTGDGAGNNSSQTQKGGSTSGGSSGGSNFKTVEAVELREHLVNMASMFQNEIQANKARFEKPPEAAKNEGSMGELRYRMMLADLAALYESPSKLDALSHRIKNYYMSTTKFEKFSCFAEFGLSVTKAALGGQFIGGIVGWERKARPPLNVSGLIKELQAGQITVEKLAQRMHADGDSADSAPAKAATGKAKKAADPAARAALGKSDAAAKDKQAKKSKGGGGNEYWVLTDNARHLVIESDVLKSLKSEFNVKDSVTRVAKIENQDAQDERAALMDELDEMVASGKMTEKDKKIAVKQLDHLFVKHGKQAKEAAIGVERIFKQLDFHYRKARDYHKLFLAIDDMAIARQEWPIRLRSCRQCYQYAYNLYEFHHELEKVERYLLASASIVAELAEEADTFAAYQQPVWQVLDGLTKRWVQSNPNHEHCLEKRGRKAKGKHCYGPAGPWKGDTPRRPI